MNKDSLVVEPLKGLKNNFKDKFTNFLDRFLGTNPQEIPEMTYETVVEHFSKIRLGDTKVKQAVVLRQPHDQSEHLILMCLDENGDPVRGALGKSYTKEFLVHKIDSELGEALSESKNVLRFSFRERSKN